MRLRPLLLATCVPACWGIGSEVAAAPANSLSPLNPAGPAWEAQRRAVQLLDAALEAHGASDPAKIRTVELKRKGTRTLFNQSPDWKKPPVLARQRATIIYDSVGRLFIEDREEFDVPGGFRLTTQRALGPDGGWQVDPQRRGTGDFAQRAEAAGWGAAELAFIRTTPPLMIRHALTRASSLRFRGRVVEEGQSFDLVDMADTDGTMLTLRFDGESSLLAGYDLLGDDLIAGDQLTEVHFTYYRSIGGVWLPAHRQEIRNGQTVLDHRLDWTLNVAVPKHPLRPPSGYRPAAENPFEPDNLKLAEGRVAASELAGRVTHGIDDRRFAAASADPVPRRPVEPARRGLSRPGDSADSRGAAGDQAAWA